MRYIGLDAPEVANPEEGTLVECGGDEARSANATLVEGREVVLERDDSDRDRFGRLLRHVWLPAADGLQLVGEGLVESGMVEARSYPPDTAPDDLLDRAGHRAREAGLGILGKLLVRRSCRQLDELAECVHKPHLRGGPRAHSQQRRLGDHDRDAASA